MFSYNQPVRQRAGARLVILTLISVLLAGAGLATSSGPAFAAGAPCKTTKVYSGGRLFKEQTVCYSTPVIDHTGFKTGYTDSVYNGLSKAISAKCEATTSTTVTRSLSLSASAEASAWIFARVSASVSGGVSKSLSSGYSTSATFSVSPKKTVSCTRGIVTKGFYTKKSVTTKSYTYQGKKLHRVSTSKSPVVTVRGSGPNMAQWKIK